MIAYLSIAVKNYAAHYAGLPKACWEGIILTLINAISVGIYFFLSLYFVDILHMDIATAGILISCYGFGTITGGIIGGKLSDLISPRLISIISLLFQALTYFLLAKLSSIELLMLNLFMQGAASYGFKISNNVWMLSQCTQSSLRAKTINMVYVASNLGFGISGILLGIFTQYGFNFIFNLSSTLLFLAALYLIYQRTLTLSSNEKTIVENKFDQPIIPSRKIDRYIVTLILICLFAVGLIIAQLSATYPVYVQDAFPKLGVKAVSILFILDTVLIVLFQAPLANYLNRYNKILLVGIGALFMGFGMLILSFSFVFTLALLSCVIWTTGEMIFMSNAQLVCYEKGAEKKKGQALGVYQATYAASTIIGPSIGGYIYHALGGNMLWYISAVIGVLCFLACNYCKKYS